MTWAPEQAPAYPEPQQYYRVNLAALSWRELRAASPLVAFLILAPPVAVCKLLRIPLRIGGPMPREITFAPADPASFQARRERVDYYFRTLEPLGFENFTTYRVPEFPLDKLQFAFVNRAEEAYAVVGQLMLPGTMRVRCDFLTWLADGRPVQTTDMVEEAAASQPPHWHVQVLKGATPGELWEAHRAAVGQLSPSAGGVSGPVDADHYVDQQRRATREEVDFHAARGVYLPVHRR